MNGYELILESHKIIEENTLKDRLFKYKLKKKDIKTVPEAIKFLQNNGFEVKNKRWK